MPCRPWCVVSLWVLGVLLAGVLFVWQSSVLSFSLLPTQPLWVITFAVLGALMLGTLGLIAGLWADKFDQMAAFQNFIIMPMTFLSGVFYSIHSLPRFLAEREPPQPVLLHDRWFPFWLLWPKRRVALVELERGGVCLLAWCPPLSRCYLLRTGYKIRG